METTRTLHSVRVRNDLWAAFIVWQTNEYHNSFQDFVEECLLEKLGLKGNIQEVITEREKEIIKLQELNRLSKEFLINNNKKLNTVETVRIKALSLLLKEPYDNWSYLNKKHAVKVGNFKNRDELDIWVKEQQKDII